jgi:hypothetical protein
MRKYLRVEEDLDPDADDLPAPSIAADLTPPPTPADKPAPAKIALVRNRLS